MRFVQHRFLWTVLGAVARCGTPCGRPGAADLNPTLQAPPIPCGASTEHTITLRVCAGATGAPYGFSIHWKTYADWLVNGWAQGDSFCGASFSGNASGTQFNLVAGGCVNVNIGGIIEGN